MSPENDDFKDLSLGITASLARSESEQSIDRMLKEIRGNALTVICGEPGCGKSLLLAHLIGVAKGEAYFFEEGYHLRNRELAAKRAARMRDRAITMGRPAYFVTDLPRRLTDPYTGELMERFVMVDPGSAMSMADAIVRLKRTGVADECHWMIVKNLSGLTGQSGIFRFSDIANVYWCGFVDFCNHKGWSHELTYPEAQALEKRITKKLHIPAFYKDSGIVGLVSV